MRTALVWITKKKKETGGALASRTWNRGTKRDHQRPISTPRLLRSKDLLDWEVATLLLFWFRLKKRLVRVPRKDAKTELGKTRATKIHPTTTR
jgi:hypothetical protein